VGDGNSSLYECKNTFDICFSFSRSSLDLMLNYKLVVQRRPKYSFTHCLAVGQLDDWLYMHDIGYA